VTHPFWNRLLIAKAETPDVIVGAMRELDRILCDDPLENSESRPGIRRVAFARPLGILFEIHRSTATVEIGDAWQFRTT